LDGEEADFVEALVASESKSGGPRVYEASGGVSESSPSGRQRRTSRVRSSSRGVRADFRCYAYFETTAGLEPFHVLPSPNACFWDDDWCDGI